MKKIILFFSLFTLLFSVLASTLNITTPTAKAAIPSSHPRIWLNADKLSELQAKVSANHSTWTSLQSWANSNLSRTYTSEFYALNTGELVNFAIVYKMTGNSTYARAAIDKMLYMWDHPYSSTSVTSLDAWVTGNSWYTARYLVPSSAIIFDWCYEVMTEAERTRFINQLDTWASMIAVSPTPAWAWHDSSSNYWYGYMWALTTAGYALYGHSNNATTYLDYVKNTMVPEALAQVNNQALAWDISTGNFAYGRSKGGEWSEGNAYGIVNTEMLAATLFAIQNAEGINNFSQTSFFDEYIVHSITNQPPGSLAMIDAGDAYIDNINDGKLKGPFIMAVAGAVAKNPSSTSARYGKYWLDQYLTSSSNTYKRFEDFIWYPLNTSGLNYTTQLSRDYFAEGMQIQNYRSSWSSDATWFYSRFNMHYSDHSNDGQGGHFSLWKNGWLIKDYAYTRYEGPAPNDAVHNVVYLPPDGDQANGMLWDQPDILHRLNTSDYLYYAADASDVFSGPEVRCDWRACNVLLNQRSFFYLKGSDHLVIYDRIQTEAAADQKIWQVYLENAPQISGNIATASNGSAKVFIKTLLPASPTISANTNSGEDRLQVRYSQAATNNNFLHVLEVKDNSVTTMNPTEYLVSTNGNLVGALINQQEIVMFSQNGVNVDTAVYNITASSAARHYLTGLRANTAYNFSGPSLNSSGTTNSEGVLSFTTSGAGQVSLSLASGVTPQTCTQLGYYCCPANCTCSQSQSATGCATGETCCTSQSVCLQPTQCVDQDGDGYSITGGTCGTVDCNDANSAINPGRTEILNNGLDDDCNSATPDTIVCTPQWTCGNWTICQNSLHTRTCTDTNNCGVSTNQPILSEACQMPSCTESWSCGEWSACQNSSASRVCTDANNCGTVVNKPETSLSCVNDTVPTPPGGGGGGGGTPISCQENWACGAWGSCVQNSQSRACTDQNNCGTSNLKPIATQTCSSAIIGDTEEILEPLPPSNPSSSGSTIGSSYSLTNRLKGMILLQVEEHGEAWYVKPDTGKRIYMKDGAAAYSMMRNLSLGITNADLNKIPVGFEDRFECLDSDHDELCDKLEEGLGTDPYDDDTDNDGYKDGAEVKSNYDPLSTGKLNYDYSLVSRLKGLILLQVETNGEAWYMNPADGKRYYMPDGPSAYQIMRYLSLGITNADLSKIAIE